MSWQSHTKKEKEKEKEGEDGQERKAKISAVY